MVDTKFLVITILCYVGIFAVIFAVCFCAWLRYIRSAGKSPHARTRQPMAQLRVQSPEHQPLAYTGTPRPALYIHQHQSNAAPIGYPATHFHTHRQEYNVGLARGALQRIPFVNKHFPVEVNFPPGSQNRARHQTHHPALAYRETSQDSSDFSDVTSSRCDNDIARQEPSLDEAGGRVAEVSSRQSFSGSETCDDRELDGEAHQGHWRSTYSYSESRDDTEGLSVDSVSGHLWGDLRAERLGSPRSSRKDNCHKQSRCPKNLSFTKTR